MNKTAVAVILLTVIGLHLLTMNVLYPKIVLFWAWIWGAMGLMLAIPLVGATKIICDYINSRRGLGAWLGN